jgi:hypothetical protein
MGVLRQIVLGCSAAAIVAGAPAIALAQAQPSPAPAPTPAPQPAPLPPVPSGDPFDLRSRNDLDYSRMRAGESVSSFYADLQKQREQYVAAGDFADCVVNLNPGQARLLLDQAVPGKVKRTRSRGRFLNRFQGCVSSQSRISEPLLNGALAETVVARTVPVDALPAAGNEKTVKSFMTSVELKQRSGTDPLPLIQLTAQCRTGFAPQQARAVLDTPLGSEEQKKAIGLLHALTPACDSFEVPEPMDVHFERAYIAQAVYYWSDFAPAFTQQEQSKRDI